MSVGLEGTAPDGAWFVRCCRDLTGVQMVDTELADHGGEA